MIAVRAAGSPTEYVPDEDLLMGRVVAVTELRARFLHGAEPGRSMN